MEMKKVNLRLPTSLLDAIQVVIDDNGWGRKQWHFYTAGILQLLASGDVEMRRRVSEIARSYSAGELEGVIRERGAGIMEARSSAKESEQGGESGSGRKQLPGKARRKPGPAKA